MATHQRVTRMLGHHEADHIPFTDSPWDSTMARWQREGLPKEMDWRDYFGLDHFESIGADNSPRLPRRTIQETDDYVIQYTSWGGHTRTRFLCYCGGWLPFPSGQGGVG